MSRTVTLAGYALLGSALLAYQALGLLGGRTATLGQAVRRLAGTRSGRWLVLATWLWLGWHLFVRASR